MQLVRIHLNSAGANDVSEELNFVCAKLALVKVECHAGLDQTLN